MKGAGIIYISQQQEFIIGCESAAAEYTLNEPSDTSSSVCPESAVLANCKT